MIKTCTLIKKISLTHDVYELHYQSCEKLTMIPGQFITFILPGIGARCYSVLELIDDDIIVLVIKKWEISNGGRGGSIILCDAKVGEIFKYVGPAGHFTLNEGIKNRLFLGTGTGLVPLYNQIIAGLHNKKQEKYRLIFGARFKKDLYYIERYETLKKLYGNNFDYTLTVSREDADDVIHKGYVTDFLSKDIINQFDEYYICGAPAMIESCIKKLSDYGVSQESIFFEKYF